jgi:hypothetical protein
VARFNYILHVLSDGKYQKNCYKNKLKTSKHLNIVPIKVQAISLNVLLATIYRWDKIIYDLSA